MKSLLNTKSHATDFALFVARVGLGAMFMLHGEGKIFGGVEKWEKLGRSMENFGIDFAPAFWGFMASFAEFGGGALLILGLFTRPACFLLVITMIVAATRHMLPPETIAQVAKDLVAPKTTMDLLKEASHAIEAGCVFFALMLIGPGKWSLDKKLFG